MRNVAVPLDEIVKIAGGGTPSTNRPEYFRGRIPWVSPKDMKCWDIVDSLDHVTEEAIANSSTTLIARDAVLVVTRSGVLKHTLPVAINRVPVTLNQDMKALICGERVIPDYLARALQALSSKLLQTVRGTTADNISTDVLRALEIPLPTLPEQRRIARRLEQADRLVRTRRYTLELANTFLPAAFLELFGDQNPAVNQWLAVPLGEHLEALEGGVNFNPVGENDPASDWRVLKVSAVSWSNFLAEESKPISPAESFGEKLIVQLGDLIMSRANTVELVGAIARVRTPPPKVLLPDKLWRLKLRAASQLLPDFLLYALRSSVVRREIQIRASGTSGSMKNISKEDVRELRLPLPPLPLQKKFAVVVERVERLRAVQSEALRQAEHLFQTLLHSAFCETDSPPAKAEAVVVTQEVT